ncbi:MAG: hypothetical protein A2156_03285 [Deltaproteobacteria bacterium RBG_16_48_10]|nr:MAG: hypothetical protein A2156_03285 [Deltaproteobacteria bacterium RBG_16_48_10]
MFRLLLKPLSLLLLFWLGAIGLGHLSLSALRVQFKRGERLLFSAGSGLMIWWLWFLGLGLLGLFRDYIAWFFLLGFGLHGLWRFSGIITGPPLSRPRMTPWNVTLGAIILVNALYPLLVYGLLPPLTWDEIAYHLAIPKIYIASGGIAPIPYSFFSNWPFGLEMLYSLALLLGSHGEVLAHMMHWSLSLLTSAGLWYFGTQQRERVGLLAAAVFLSLPLIKELAGAGVVDVGLTDYSWLAFMAWWYWRVKRDWRWLCLAGLMAGGAASLKLTGASVALLLSGMTLLTRTGDGLKARLKNSAILGIIALMIVCPWYIKSWVFTGDPVFPFGSRIFPSSNWDALGTHSLLHYLHAINMPFTLTSYLSGPIQLVLYPKRFDWLSLGYILVWLIPFGLIGMRREKLLWWLLFYLLGYYSIWFCLTHQIRFLLPMLPMAVFLAAWGGAWLVARMGTLGKGVVIVCLLMELPIVQAVPRKMLLDRISYLTGHQSRSEIVTAAVNPFPAFEYINRSLPTGVRLLLAPYEVRGYYLDRDYVWAHPIGQRFFRFEQIPDGSSLRQALAANGIDYLLDNRQEWDIVLTKYKYYDHLIRLLDELITAYGEKLYSAGDISVYRLRK